MTKGCFPTAPLMVVDDNWDSLAATESRLRDSGINHLIPCRHGDEMPALLRQREFSAVLLELDSLSNDPEQLLSEVVRDCPQIPVVVASRSNDIERAVRCIRIGAFDYVADSADSEHQRLIRALKNAVAIRELREENRALRDCVLSGELKTPTAFANLITENERLLTLFRYAESVARSTAPLLITGEMGTGKTALARTVHALSGRQGEFVEVDVSRVRGDKLLAALFCGDGTKATALVERAAGGTLYFDEIGQLNSTAQDAVHQLLRVGHYRPPGQQAPVAADVRIISSSRDNLWHQVRGQEFRKDLNFILRVNHLHMPALRERGSDLRPLVEHFVGAAAEEMRVEKPRISEELMRILGGYAFPANIRELRHMLFCAVRSGGGNGLAIEPIRRHIDQTQIVGGAPPVHVPDSTALDFGNQLPTMKEVTELLLREAMLRAKGNQSVAGRLLGISQQAVSKRLKLLTDRE